MFTGMRWHILDAIHETPDQLPSGSARGGGLGPNFLSFDLSQEIGLSSSAPIGDGADVSTEQCRPSLLPEQQIGVRAEERASPVHDRLGEHVAHGLAIVVVADPCLCLNLSPVLE